MHHPHTAPPAFVGIPDELPQRFPRLVTAQPVQINLPLQAPMPFAQFLRHIGADAAAPVAELVVGVEQGGDVKVVAETFAQHVVVIQHLLQSQGFGGLAGQGHARRMRERLDRAHRPLEQMALGLGGFLKALALGFLGGGPGGVGFQLGFDGRQVFQAAGLHHSHALQAAKSFRRAAVTTDSAPPSTRFGLGRR